jgi:dihydroorotate dehydrogenase electron transfer subunit
LFRVVGRGTWWLSRCRPEARLNLIGPLGNSFKLQPSNTEPIFLVAGGIGIAPLFELISRLVEGRETDWARESLHLFYGARTASELLPRKIFEDLGISINISTDDGSAGYHGYVTRLFQRVAMERGLRPAVLYACGPLAMQYHVSKWTIANGVPSQLSLESLMACGVGACLGCALPSSDPTDAEADHYVHVCKDGPIFSAESIQWNKIQKQLMQPPTFLFS